MSTSSAPAPASITDKKDSATSTVAVVASDEQAKLEAENQRLRALLAQQAKEQKTSEKEQKTGGSNQLTFFLSPPNTSTPITSGSYSHVFSGSADGDEKVKERIGFRVTSGAINVDMRTVNRIEAALSTGEFEDQPQEPILAEAVPEAVGLFGRIRSAVSGFVFGTPQMDEKKQIVAYKKSKVDVFNAGAVMYSMNTVVGFIIRKYHADRMEDFKTVVGDVDSQAKKYLAHHPAFGDEFDYYNVMALARLTLANLFDFSTGNFFTTLNFAIQCMNELIFLSKFIYNAYRAGSLKPGLKSLCYDGDTFSWPMFIDNLLPALAVVLAIKAGITIASLPDWVKEKYDVVKDDLPYTPQTGFAGCPVDVKTSVNSCMVATIQAASAILAAKVMPELETLEMIVAAWYGARALTIIAPPVINASAKAISWCRSPSVSAEDQGDIENPSTRTGIRYRALNANADES